MTVEADYRWAGGCRGRRLPRGRRRGKRSGEWLFLTPRRGVFCPLNALANFNSIHTRQCIRLKRALQSDGSCRVNRMRHRLSIRCTFAFQSIETFLAFLTWFSGPRGKVDANVLAVSGMGPASVKISRWTTAIQRLRKRKAHGA